MSALERVKADRVVQLRVHDRGRGVLEFQFEQGIGRRVIGGCALAYPQQGQMMRMAGGPTRDAIRAKKLNEALEEFNVCLRDWCT